MGSLLCPQEVFQFLLFSCHGFKADEYIYYMYTMYINTYIYNIPGNYPIILGMVDRNKTLFTYRFGENYDRFRDLDFTPVFLDDTSSLFSNSTFEQEAKNICGENQECLFDIAVTGKTSIGEETLELVNELEEKINNSKIGKGIYRIRTNEFYMYMQV